MFCLYASFFFQNTFENQDTVENVGSVFDQYSGVVFRHQNSMVSSTTVTVNLCLPENPILQLGPHPLIQNKTNFYCIVLNSLGPEDAKRIASWRKNSPWKFSPASLASRSQIPLYSPPSGAWSLRRSLDRRLDPQHSDCFDRVSFDSHSFLIQRGRTTKQNLKLKRQNSFQRTNHSRSHFITCSTLDHRSQCASVVNPLVLVSICVKRAIVSQFRFTFSVYFAPVSTAFLSFAVKCVCLLGEVYCCLVLLGYLLLSFMFNPWALLFYIVCLLFYFGFLFLLSFPLDRSRASNIFSFSISKARFPN